MIMKSLAAPFAVKSTNSGFTEFTNLELNKEDNALMDFQQVIELAETRPSVHTFRRPNY